jgi:hypothetical protein
MAREDALEAPFPDLTASSSHHEQHGLSTTPESHGALGSTTSAGHNQIPRLDAKVKSTHGNHPNTMRRFPCQAKFESFCIPGKNLCDNRSITTQANELYSTSRRRSRWSAINIDSRLVKNSPSYSIRRASHFYSTVFSLARIGVSQRRKTKGALRRGLGNRYIFTSRTGREGAVEKTRG